MKILIACSGSGGHIFPALSSAKELKKQNCEIFFLQTNQENIDELIAFMGFNLVYSNLEGISFLGLKNKVQSLFKLFLAAVNSFRIIAKIKPEVVIGFGGYHSGPIIVAAHLLKIPTLIHEQNVLPGKANAILSKFANRVAISFKESKDYFKSKKIVFTGCPLRPEVLGISKEDALSKYNFAKDKFTILVMGGSQGSRSINLHFVKAVSLLEQKDKIQIIHLTGKRDYEFVSKEYSKISVRCLVFDFLEEIGYAYKLADFIISRAGASTVSEIIALAIPAIIIPYPFARKHQTANAKILSDAGAAVLIEEERLSAQLLQEQISLLISNKAKLDQMKQAFKRFPAFNAAENLSREVLSLKRQ
ncbi:MAG: undecaprenyldiphospho-muramoylpentapeptide beta-N-acetylglucosaminyltransferase [Candidatus Omnitrophica bacterium]|nr:undecaprenyldiphospho-muramoylpentapeptide beta-N-acetylglucosaminyltransferase [Candidatus Omnitrophota bacterium]